MNSKVRSLGIVTALIALSSLSCAERQNSWQNLRGAAAITPAGQQIQLFGNDYLQVIDDAGKPIANASLLMGYEPGNPFNGNVIKTDANGRANVPADWKAALPLTVQAEGFVTTTIPVAQPGNMTIQLSSQEGAQEIEVKGPTNGYGRLIQDGKVDFGLVIPALSRDQLLNFDVSSMISPRADQIEIIGNKINLPSNIALPKQNETYIFPIEFDKPDYRVYMRQPGQYKMTAIHGQFPLQRVVGDIRAGKSIFEVINHFNFMESGQKDVSLTENVSDLAMDVNQTRFEGSTKIKAPAITGNQVMIAVNLAEQDGLMMPTDLKRLNANQSINLKSTGQSGSILSLLMEENPTNILNEAKEEMISLFAPLFDLAALLPIGGPLTERPPLDFSRLSFAIAPSAGGAEPQFLSLLSKPELKDNTIKMQAPQILPGLTPIATYLVFSEVEVLGEGKAKSERRTRLWEVWSQAWLEQVELPKIEFERKADRKYRWEVMFLARPTTFLGEPAISQRVDLKTITHITRNALDI